MIALTTCSQEEEKHRGSHPGPGAAVLLVADGNVPEVP